jgi:hypothetical protein
VEAGKQVPMGGCVDQDDGLLHAQFGLNLRHGPEQGKDRIGDDTREVDDVVTVGQ